MFFRFLARSAILVFVVLVLQRPLSSPPPSSEPMKDQKGHQKSAK